MASLPRRRKLPTRGCLSVVSEWCRSFCVLDTANYALRGRSSSRVTLRADETRLYFMRLRLLTKQALRSGKLTPELEKARGEAVPTFTHFLDLPMLFVIVALGALKPETWTLFAMGSVIALAITTTLTVYVPRLYPLGSERTP